MWLVVLCSRAFSFLPLADQSCASASVGGSQRDLFSEIAHIFALRQTHSEVLLDEPYKTFDSCGGKRVPVT